MSMPGASSSKSVSVALGTRYPSRLVARNPGPVSGSLRTQWTDETDSASFDFSNIRATDEETDDFWNGDRSFNTGILVYDPSYNVYQGAPVSVYEHSVLFNRFRDGNRPVTGQTLIDGKDITVITLDGKLDRAASDTVSVDVEPVSSSDRTIQVTDTGSGNVELTFKSQFPEATWESILEAEYDPDGTAPDKYISDISDTGDDSPYDITLELEPDTNYNLRMANVGVGNGIPERELAYVTDVEGDGSSVTEGNTQELVIEARDEHNNPLSDVTVELDEGDSDADSSEFDDVKKTTSADGRVSFSYEPSSTGDKDIVFSASEQDDVPDSVPAEQEVTFDVTVQASGGGGGGGGGGDGDGDGDGQPPIIETFDVTDNSFEIGWYSSALYEIEWTVTDPDGDIGPDSVTVFVYNKDDNEMQDTFSGLDKTETSSGNWDYDNQYEIQLEAEDDAGNKVCKVIKGKADGNSNNENKKTC
ncbi:hypothetical protein ACFR9U_00520 [Halorientalis brevis]|uniref:Big-1 domain-containing protein n=1 Tax=Halorientalis brevis TaxID=1126241 RepID=A0ABD6C6L0_9EURY|nr:hypothetical protein [Halorientalis brevis]